MLSDALADYDEKRLDLIKRCIPPLTTVTAETGPLQTDYAAFTWTKLHSFQVLDEKPFAAEHMSARDARNIAGRWPTVNDRHPFSSLWSIHLDLPTGQWTIMARFATLPLEASTVELDALALDPETDYLAFDFWKQRYMGVVRGRLDVPKIELGHCQIVALREALDRPQFLASSRHVSMDAISLKSQQWADNTLTFGIEGVCGTTETYWVHVPKGYRLAEVAGDGLQAKTGREVADQAGGKAAAIEVMFPAAAQDTTKGTLTLRLTR